MAINTYPAVASPVKSVQRGSAAGAGTVTINAIDINKSMVNIFGTTSSGTVAASFGLNAPGAGNTRSYSYSNYGFNNFNTYIGMSGATNSAGGSTSLGFNTHYIETAVNAGTAPTPNAGSNNLVAAVVQGYLSNSTSLVVTGACRYEIVEFN